MSPDLDTQDLTDDAVLGGRLSILQPRVGHRAGHDAILLAAATAATGGNHAVDLGAGVGTAGLALATRVDGVSVTLVDIDSNLVTLARENAARNRLANRVFAVTLDVAAPLRTVGDLATGSADHVLMNPPFNDPSRQHVSPNPRRRVAHCSSREMLVSWIRTAGRILRPGGTVTLIFRADGIGDVLQALGAGFGAIAVRPIYAKPSASAIRILTRAVKSSRAPTSLRPGFLLNGADGRPTAEAEAVLRGGAPLPFDPAEQLPR
jgi:tRNA1(Val) A37 N6-methylase TrmN6